MTPRELIEAALKATELRSIRQLGELAGIDHSMLSVWQNNKRPIPFEEAAVLAHLAGLPPSQTAAKIRQHMAANRKMRALLAKIAGTAATVLAAVYSPHSHAANNVYSSTMSGSVYIM